MKITMLMLPTTVESDTTPKRRTPIRTMDQGRQSKKVSSVHHDVMERGGEVFCAGVKTEAGAGGGGGRSAMGGGSVSNGYKHLVWFADFKLCSISTNMKSSSHLTLLIVLAV